MTPHWRPGEPDPREHWCEAPGCRAWGDYGFRVRGRTYWFCRADRYRGERMLPAAMLAAGDAPANAVRPPAQGSLL